MDAQTFVALLEAQVATKVETLALASSSGEPGPGLRVADLLATALRNELEASEEAALWLTQESDVEVKLSLARQCGDEARHYRLIEARLRELGVDPTAHAPQVASYTPMYAFLRDLPSTVERIAAGPFAREALALARNAVFIDYCTAQGDAGTAALYRDTIQPDEAHHHQLGRQLLLRLASDDATQAKAQAAVDRTLSLAGELQEIARLQKGICRAPGC